MSWLQNFLVFPQTSSLFTLLICLIAFCMCDLIKARLHCSAWHGYKLCVRKGSISHFLQISSKWVKSIYSPSFPAKYCFMGQGDWIEKKKKLALVP